MARILRSRTMVATRLLNDERLLISQSAAIFSGRFYYVMRWNNHGGP